MITKIKNMIKRHTVYRTTYNELSRLSNTELADIGIHRGNIPYIAEQQAKKYV